MKKLFAWMNLFIFNNCPECNSDAPEKYECFVCRGKTYIDKKDKAEIWKRFNCYYELTKVFKYSNPTRMKDHFKYKKPCGAKSFDSKPCDYSKYCNCGQCDFK